MRSPILLTDEQRSLNLEMASEHLKEVFAKYPMPTKMDCCPHCAPDEDDLKAIYQGNSYMYLIKAMSTWGDEKDFKYFLPKALPYALGIREFELIMSKISGVDKWSMDELLALRLWFYAYLQIECLDGFKCDVQSTREEAQSCLDGKKYYQFIDAPIYNFYDDDRSSFMDFFEVTPLAVFGNVLELWPQNDLDLLVFAFCRKGSLLFGTLSSSFGRDIVSNWLLRVKKAIEEQLMKTASTHVKKLFYDALERITESNLWI
jgi:hypothetical protein